MHRAGISDGGLRAQRVDIPRSDCLSSSLVRFNRCQTESVRAGMSLFHQTSFCKERAKQQVAHLLRREKAATPSLTVLLRVGSFLPTSDLKTWQRDVPRSLYAQFRLEKSRRALTCRASVTSWDGLMHEGRGVVRAATHLAAWGSLRVLVFYPQCKMYASRYQYPDKTF